MRDRKLVNAAGQPMSFTILLSDPSLERLALPYSQSLQRLGVEASVRTVDPAQYQRLMEEFDYDVTTGDVENVHHAVAMDPLTAALLTLEQIRAMTDELLAAHADRLPEALRP